MSSKEKKFISKLVVLSLITFVILYIVYKLQWFVELNTFINNIQQNFKSTINTPRPKTTNINLVEPLSKTIEKASECGIFKQIEEKDSSRWNVYMVGAVLSMTLGLVYIVAGRFQ